MSSDGAYTRTYHIFCCELVKDIFIYASEKWVLILIILADLEEAFMVLSIEIEKKFHRRPE